MLIGEGGNVIGDAGVGLVGVTGHPVDGACDNGERATGDGTFQMTAGEERGLLGVEGDVGEVVGAVGTKGEGEGGAA